MTTEQQLASSFFSSHLYGSLFVSSQTMNILRSHVPPDLFNRIAPLLQLLLPVKYQRRFSRRLRQRFNFEREDANLLALATFGTDRLDRILGMEWTTTQAYRKQVNTGVPARVGGDIVFAAIVDVTCACCGGVMSLFYQADILPGITIKRGRFAWR